MILYRLLGIFVLLSMAAACTSTSNKKIIAQVEDEKLYLDAIEIPKGLSAKDSVDYLKQYAQLWVSKQLMKNEAEITLGDWKNRIDSLTQEYMDNLLISLFEEKIIQDAKVMVSEQEALQYYEKHPDDFVLTEPIIKGKYVAVDEKYPDFKILSDKLRSTKREDLNDFEKRAKEAKATYEFDNQHWKYYSEIQIVLGIEITNSEEALQSGKELSGLQNGRHYLLIISEVRTVGELIPYSKAKEMVYRMVRTEKEQEILRAYRNKMYENSLSSSQIKINL